MVDKADSKSNPGAGRILVAEDNDFVRMQIVRFLGEAGFDLVEARDGNAALEQMSGSIDMAIVDVRMEPLDGFDFIRAIRARDIGIPVILVTGDHNPDLLSESAKWGVAAVLMKPVQRDRLVGTVNRTLRARERAS
ncbi:MAG: response regulator [Alphaproteobacteria bacterium]